MKTINTNEVFTVVNENGVAIDVRLEKTEGKFFDIIAESTYRKTDDNKPHPEEASRKAVQAERNTQARLTTLEERVEDLNRIANAHHYALHSHELKDNDSRGPMPSKGAFEQIDELRQRVK